MAGRSVITAAILAAALGSGCGASLAPELGEGPADRALTARSVAIQWVRTSADNLGLVYGDWAERPGWGRYLVARAGASAGDPEAPALERDGADNDGDGLVDEPGERFPEEVLLPGHRTGDDAWVRVEYVRDDSGRVILYGDHDNNIFTADARNLERGWGIVRVTAHAEAGGDSAMLGADLSRPPFYLPAAALYTGSGSIRFEGTRFLISGFDRNPVTGTPYVDRRAGFGILTRDHRDSIRAALDADQLDRVEGFGSAPSLDTYYGSLYGALGGGDMVMNLPPKGDVVDPPSGSGLLWVYGNLVVNGEFRWVGAILAEGGITFRGSGAGIHVFGFVGSAGVAAADTVAGATELFYSSEALVPLARHNPYRILPPGPP